MRTDCTRDNRATRLPSTTTLGFGLSKAKRGNWVQFDYNGQPLCGRVVGGVTADGKRYLEVIALLGACRIPAVRWIAPADVTDCYAEPPRAAFDLMCGEWKDPATILAKVGG